jgi:hypothetical protein
MPVPWFWGSHDYCGLAMRVTRVVLYVVVVAVIAAVVVGAVSVISARPQLNDAKQHVNTTWTPLATELGPRYAALTVADAKLQTLTGPVRTLADRVHTALNSWNNAKARGRVADQVRAANDLEAFSRRLVVAARASERVKSDPQMVSAVDAFANDKTFTAAGITTVATFNQAVKDYEKERNGPVRGVVSTVLDAPDIPSFAPAPV